MSGKSDTNVALPQDQPVAAALHLDMLNEVLFSAWWNAALELTMNAEEVNQLLPDFSFLDVKWSQFSFSLPPILSDCNNKSLLRLQIGDIYMTGESGLGGTPFEYAGYMTAEVDVQLLPEGQEITLGINGIVDFNVDIVSVSEGWPGTLVELEESMSTMLMSKLEEMITESLGGITIPALDLSSMDPSVPTGTTITLDTDETAKGEGYLILKGSL